MTSPWLDKLAATLPRKRRHRRVWPRGGIPAEFFGDVGGHLMTPEIERKLGVPAIAAWRELLHTRGNQAVPCRVSLVQLLVKLRSRSMLHMGPRVDPARIVAVARRPDAGWSTSRLDRAIRRLKDAGLIAWSHREPDVSWVDGVKRFASTLDVMVLGAVDDDGCPEATHVKLWVPTTTVEWARNAPGRGGRRDVLHVQSDAEAGQSDAEPLSRNAELEGQSDASKISERGSVPSVLSEQKETGGGPPVALAGSRDDQRRSTASLPAMPADLETMLRRREVATARRLGVPFDSEYGRTRPALTWFDARYAELRAFEVEAGAVDPMDRYDRHARKGAA